MVTTSQTTTMAGIMIAASCPSRPHHSKQSAETVWYRPCAIIVIAHRQTAVQMIVNGQRIRKPAHATSATSGIGEQPTRRHRARDPPTGGCSPRAGTGYDAPVARDTLNADFERRSLWSATMPALPDRSGRALPDTADVVVVGGGYAGIKAAPSSLGAASRSRCSRPRRSAGARRRGTAASSTRGTSGGRASWSGVMARRRGRALRRHAGGFETVKRLIADEAIDCDFRENGYVELAYAASHVRDLAQMRESLAGRGVASTLVPREKLREEIGTDAYHGGLVVPGSGSLHPGRYFSGLAAAADVRARTCTKVSAPRPIRRQADGRFVVETERGAILARDVFVATNGYTDGVAPSLRRRIIPSGATSSPASRCPKTRRTSSRPKGRAFFDTKNFLYYWHVSADRRMVFGGRAASCRLGRADRRDPVSRASPRSIRRWPDKRIHYAWGGDVGFTLDRMPHAGRT